MSYPISAIDGIDDDVVKALKSIGIRTTEKLLDAAKDPKGRRTLADRLGCDPKCLLDWANMADRMRIKGMGREYAALLPQVGVDTVRELKYRNPAKLAAAMADANRKRKLVRVLPSEKAIERWIEEAKALTILIKY